VIDGIQIGARAIIGAGAVVVRDIPNGVVAYGTPARVIRKIDEQD
jgi:acetyltransferase-like isoleucine patch superfamily enzyme